MEPSEMTSSSTDGMAPDRRRAATVLLAAVALVTVLLTSLLVGTVLLVDAATSTA